MEGIVSMDDYLKVQEKLKQKIERLEKALAIKNSIVDLQDLEINKLKEKLGQAINLNIVPVVNGALIKSIEKALSQILTDMPYGISKQEIKEILTEILVVIREDSKKDWMYGLDLDGSE